MTVTKKKLDMSINVSVRINKKPPLCCNNDLYMDKVQGNYSSLLLKIFIELYSFMWEPDYAYHSPSDLQVALEIFDVIIFPLWESSG